MAPNRGFAGGARFVIDCLYVAASARDARYTRICVASIRYFYPDVPIKLLVGGPLERGLAEELRRYWDVGVADLPAGDYGWGFVKLEPLFGRPGERFMVLDSDTVIAGPVLDLWPADDAAPFLVDDEVQTDSEIRRLYYDWRHMSQIDREARPPVFVFNSGQWFGTAGVLSRANFSQWLDWTMPRQLRYPQIFKQGEQGAFNYVLNEEALIGIEVRRRNIMHWPGNGMGGLNVPGVADRSATPLVVHWAGMKKPVLGSMVGADILRFFEKHYYSRLPGRQGRRILRGARYPLDGWQRSLRLRLRHRVRRHDALATGGNLV